MIQLRIAKSLAEFTIAKELVIKIYIRVGYVTDAESADTGISAYIGTKYTTTFLAQNDADVLGTISVAGDNLRGLPMDVIYREELAHYRAGGKRIGEVCQFAVDTDRLKELRGTRTEKISELDISIGLLGLVVHYGIHGAYDYLCFAINPKHAAFYESLGCTRIGEEKQYPSVNQAPALGYILDMHALRALDGQGTGRHFLISKIMRTPPAPGFFDV